MPGSFTDIDEVGEVEELDAPDDSVLYGGEFFADEDAFDLEALFHRPEDLGDIGVFEDAYGEEAEEVGELEPEEIEALEEPDAPDRPQPVEELPAAAEEEILSLSAAKKGSPNE